MVSAPKFTASSGDKRNGETGLENRGGGRGGGSWGDFTAEDGWVEG